MWLNSYSSIGCAADDRDVAVGDAGGAQAVDRALRSVAGRVQARRRRSCVGLPERVLGGGDADLVGDGCSPAFISQIEMIGTNFENST